MNLFSLSRHLAAWIISFCVVTASSAAPQDVEHSGLKVQGEIYPNACTSTELGKLQDMLSSGKAQEMRQLQQSIEVLLCAPDNDRSRTYVRTLVPIKVQKTVESTGDRPLFKTVLRSEELITDLMATGSAWSATVRVEGNKVALDYFANEACVKSVTFTYINSRWSVSEFGQACD